MARKKSSRSKSTAGSRAASGTKQDATAAAKPTKEELVAARAKARSRGWNDMTHLSVKRFADNDPTLTAGAKRRVPYDVVVEYSPTARATCKQCGEAIQPKGTTRVVFMLQCHKGFKNAAQCHLDCAFKYNGQMQKIYSVDEFHGLKKLSKPDQASFVSRFNAFRASQSGVKQEPGTVTASTAHAGAGGAGAGAKPSVKASYLDQVKYVLANADSKRGVSQTDVEAAVESLFGKARSYSRAQLRRALKAGVEAGALKRQHAASATYTLA